MGREYRGPREDLSSSAARLAERLKEHPRFVTVGVAHPRLVVYVDGRRSVRRLETPAWWEGSPVVVVDQGRARRASV